MARKPKPAAAPEAAASPEAPPAAHPAAFEAEAYYEITVSRVVEAGGATLRPRHSYTIKGKVAADIAAAIATAKKA